MSSRLNKYLDVVSLKLDCNQDNKVHLMIPNFLLEIRNPLAKELGIKVVPTFKILKDKKVVKEVTGAKFDDLVHAIDTEEAIRPWEMILTAYYYA
uniref:Thioredoxin domain-containing protein n=1 Tax=Cucumis melo TaxID=3656 RepID=A0A9I9E562_CUCME